MVESRKCMEVAQKHGVPVVIMEPARGGRLADLPERGASVLKAADPRQERGFVGLSILLQPAQRYQRALGCIDVGADSGKRARMERKRAF